MYRIISIYKRIRVVFILSSTPSIRAAALPMICLDIIRIFRSLPAPVRPNVTMFQHARTVCVCVSYYWGGVCVVKITEQHSFSGIVW